MNKNKIICKKINGCVVCDGPDPTRLWSRFENPCPDFEEPNTIENLNERRKYEILQYRHNSSNLTQKQQFSQFSQGIGMRRGQTFGTNRKMEDGVFQHRHHHLGHRLRGQTQKKI